MLSWMVFILMMIVLFRGVGILFHIAGRILGGILGIIGWLFLGGLAVTVLGLAFYVLPIVLIAGTASLISASH